MTAWQGLGKVGVKRRLAPADYAVLPLRAAAERAAREAFVVFVRDHEVTLLDAPVGRWVEVWLDCDDPPSAHWEYRLVGAARL